MGRDETNGRQAVTMKDHDLLIEIKTTLAALVLDFGALKLSMTERLETLEQQAARKAELLDHETRLRRVERWGLMAAGALFAMQFVMKFLKVGTP